MERGGHRAPSHRWVSANVQISACASFDSHRQLRVICSVVLRRYIEAPRCRSYIVNVAARARIISPFLGDWGRLPPADVNLRGSGIRMTNESTRLVDLAAMVVAAYIAHNNVTRADLADLIANTHGVLAGLGIAPPAPAAEPRVPAVPIRKSVTPDAIICLEDGRAFKSMKRHLSTSTT